MKSLTIKGGIVNPDLVADVGPLSLERDGQTVFQIGGIDQGVNYAILKSTSVKLGGRLVIDRIASFNTFVGGQITLIKNTGNSKVTGQFTGLPEGSLVRVGTMRYFISYRGGQGSNDVVLNRPTIIAASVNNGLLSIGDPDGTSRATFAPYGHNPTRMSVAMADVTGDGIKDVIVGNGPGRTSDVRVYSGTNLQLVHQFSPLPISFRGGIQVAAADFNNDGKADIIAAAGQGDPGLVTVHSGTDLTQLKSFHPFGLAFKGGVNVAAADFNNDGTPDIVCANDGGALAEIRIFDGGNGRLIRRHFPFPKFGNILPGGGVSLAIGDYNGDGRPDIFAGAKAGYNPDVSIINGATGKRFATFHALSTKYRNGVSVAAVDLDGDKKDDIIVAPLGAPFKGSVIKYSVLSLKPFAEFTPISGSEGNNIAAST